VTQVDFVTQFPKNPTNQNGLFQLDAPNLYVGMTRGSGLLFLCSNTMLLNLWGSYRGRQGGPEPHARREVSKTLTLGPDWS
jgi:hypothetical protein